MHLAANVLDTWWISIKGQYKQKKGRHLEKKIMADLAGVLGVPWFQAFTINRAQWGRPNYLLLQN